MNRIPVAQVFNLLYRRVALGKAVDNSGASDADSGLKIRDTAEYNSAPHANAGSWSQCALIFWDWGLSMNRFNCHRFTDGTRAYYFLHFFPKSCADRQWVLVTSNNKGLNAILIYETIRIPGGSG